MCIKNIAVEKSINFFAKPFFMNNFLKKQIKMYLYLL